MSTEKTPTWTKCRLIKKDDLKGKNIDNGQER